MKIEIEVISNEIIKPSSPTPDQISPPTYNPLLLFYPADGDVKINNIEKPNQLKQSLSEILNLYYPLAGRIKDNLFVECNDEGIPFFQAEVKCRLPQVVENPEPSELNKLIPFALDDAEELPLGIQYSIFECGGIVIGLCISHKVGDASSLFTFIKYWAATARGEADHISRPDFISATLFPPINISGFKPATGITKEDVVTKRFVFRSSSIELLKEKCSPASGSLENQRPPSRVEAFEPPLPEYSFGNYYRIAFTISSIDTGEENDNLVSQIRDSIGKIDKEYVKKLQKGSEHLGFIKERAARFLRVEEEDMAKFEEDEELLQYIVPTKC
ncbi:hypothetical protein D5086_019388 [Populus alba]|uniref:Uncharacterized protein n=1 Tax=Populus alba TaxID=43335 RepID=A0ACC4BIK2_POPAL